MAPLRQAFEAAVRTTRLWPLTGSRGWARGSSCPCKAQQAVVRLLSAVRHPLPGGHPSVSQPVVAAASRSPCSPGEAIVRFLMGVMRSKDKDLRRERNRISLLWGFAPSRAVAAARVGPCVPPPDSLAAFPSEARRFQHQRVTIGLTRVCILEHWEPSSSPASCPPHTRLRAAL